MSEKVIGAKKGTFILGSFLLAVTILFTGRAAFAQGGQQFIDTEYKRDYKNIFEYRMCLARDSNWCPNGDDFKATKFDALYVNPGLGGSDPAYFWEVGGVLTPTYPTSTLGSLTRYTVKMCEAGSPELDGTCPDVYGFDVIRCLDGTRPVFYYEAGSGAYANKWIIKIQGGSHDCTEECPKEAVNPASRSHYSSAYGENSQTRNAPGIFSNNPDNNFKYYNTVMLDKCVGDRNLGDATYTDIYTGELGLEDGKGPVYFHGYRIILGTLRRLKQDFNLENAEQIVFLTQSNGSNGAYHYIDRLADHISSRLEINASVYYIGQSFFLPWPEVEYFFEKGYWPQNYTDIPTSTVTNPGIINAPNTPSTGTNACGPEFDRLDPYYSHWILNGGKILGGMTCDRTDPLFADGGAHNKVYATEDFQSGEYANSFAIWGVDNGATVTWDQSCVKAHASDPDLRACRDSGHILTHHLQTPTFLALQSGDRVLRHVAPYLTNWAPDATVWWPEDFKLRIEKIAEVIGGIEQHSECVDDDFGKHGLFIDNTVDHMAVSDWSKLARQMKANKGLEAGFNFQLQDYFMYWLQPDAPSVQCVDANPLYDVEFMPPLIKPYSPEIVDPVNEWPDYLQCKDGYYPGGSQPYQYCDDPGFGNPANPNLNKADPRWDCYGPPILEYIHVPLIVK